MKIVTNIRFRPVGGIANTLKSFIEFLCEQPGANHEIIGIEMLSSLFAMPAGEPFSANGFRYVAASTPYPVFEEVLKTESNLSQIREIYAEMRETYKSILTQSQPDLVLVNGTDLAPWCLFEAAQELGLKTVLHYHGSLTKETQHRQNKTLKHICKQIEKSFDRESVSYVFPSIICQKTIEDEVFGHTITKATVVPNPIPDIFFQEPRAQFKHGFGFVGRWTHIKNVNFIKELAQWQLEKHGLHERLYTVTNLGPGEKRDELEPLVHFLEAMPPKELARFYAERECIISPSFFETYGNVAQETIASGTPALVTPTMGVAETLRAIGAHDWIISFDDLETVKAKMEEASRTGVSDEMRESLRLNFSAEPIFSKLLQVLLNA